MSKEIIKKYIIISATILLTLLDFGMCWLFQFQWILVFVFIYIVGIANGMLILGVVNYDE